MLPSAPAPLYHNLSLVNHGIVVLEYARVIREEKVYRWNNPVILWLRNIEQEAPIRLIC